MKKEYLKIYRIKKGDTLNSIALKYNVSPTWILVENTIVPRQIKEGMIIKVK